MYHRNLTARQRTRLPKTTPSRLLETNTASEHFSYFTLNVKSQKNLPKAHAIPQDGKTLSILVLSSSLAIGKDGEALLVWSHAENISGYFDL
jgi:hypothetical protein